MDRQRQFSHKRNTVCNELRHEGKFCDAIIKVEESEFEVHKVILCSCAPYFRILFTNWADKEKRIYHIPGLKADTMSAILEYAYTGSITITEDNVQELLLAANQLNVMEVLQACCDFLEEKLSACNCISIWKLSSSLSQVGLRSTAFRYIMEHFEDIVCHDELLQLTVEELSTIIEKDDLIVRNEITVCEAVLKWIDNSQESQRHAAALMSKVRLALSGEDYIMFNLLFNDLIWNNPECINIITNAMRIISAINAYRIPFPNISNPLCRPRLPTGILLAIGGWSGGGPTNGIEAYDVRADHWINITNNQERPRAFHGAAFLNGYVYCIGGFDTMEHFNSVRRFDSRTHAWSEVAPMYFRRRCVSVTLLNGGIYAFGGYDGHTTLNTAEFYQPETNQWSTIASMHERRSDASCTALNNRIYICGGFNGQECLQTAESYNPETNQWTMISPMNSRRRGIGVIAYADCVFAVGGFDGDNILRTAEAYNPQIDTWGIVASMITPRSNFGIEVIEDKLFAIGGFSRLTTYSNVEFYDALSNEWREACDMDFSRSALSCCVLSGLPNMADYSVSRDTLKWLDDEEMESEDSA